MSETDQKLRQKLALAMYGVDHGEERLNPDESIADYLPAADHLLRALLPDLTPVIAAEERRRLRSVILRIPREYGELLDRGRVIDAIDSAGDEPSEGDPDA